MDPTRVFDAYSLQARVLPGVLAVLPPLVTLAAWFPDSYELATGLLGSIGLFAAVMLLAHYARTCGRTLERKLFEEWGGKPTTLWLRHGDGNIDRLTTARYHGCLESLIPNWHAPTPESESKDLAAADEAYETAVRWLRENTRELRLVFRENVSYGFRRNLRGLKWIGIAIAALCGIGSIAALIVLRARGRELPEAGVVTSLISMIAVLCWLIVVTKVWVRDAAEAYARALLASCEVLSRSTTSSGPIQTAISD